MYKLNKKETLGENKWLKGNRINMHDWEYSPNVISLSTAMNNFPLKENRIISRVESTE